MAHHFFEEGNDLGARLMIPAISDIGDLEAARMEEGSEEDWDSDSDEDDMLIILNDESGHVDMDVKEEMGRDQRQEADVDGKEAGEGGELNDKVVANGGIVARVGYSRFKYLSPGVYPVVNTGSVGRGRGDWKPDPSHKTAFDIHINSLEDKPWRNPGVDVSDYFNFGLDEVKWTEYCKQLNQLRLKVTMQNNIRVLNDLPPELAAAIRPPIFAMGRGIQVVSGCGERLPSVFTKQQHMRDSDAVIEIALQSSEDEEPETGDDMGRDVDLHDDLKLCGDRVSLDDETAMDGISLSDTDHDGSPFPSAKRRKMETRVEQRIIQDMGVEDDLRTTLSSDSSNVRSGSSIDYYYKRHDGGDEEVIQEGRGRHIEHKKRHHDENDLNFPRKDDHSRDVGRSLVFAKVREYPHVSYPCRNRDSERWRESFLETRQRRDSDTRGKGLKYRDMKKSEYIHEIGYRQRSKVYENEKSDKDERLHLRKRLDNDDSRGHHVKDLRPRRREYDETLMRWLGNIDDSHYVDPREDSWKQREKDERRLNQTHKKMLSNYEREGRSSVRSGRHLEDKSRAVTTKVKLVCNGLGSDTDYPCKDKRYLREHSKRNDQVEDKDISWHRGRDNVHAHGNTERTSASRAAESNKVGDDRHLDIEAVKMKKRIERFSTPMPLQKDTTAYRKVESEALVPNQSEAAVQDAKFKPERPVRKRRWMSS